ncbi:LpqB family beta-propeller domain-containing protein [Leifsonia sp. A12D58]|uniref:LpqB family beta-propeller domain-containing protein n=1 Tax=Leifsonia sp. A12D58 TaxID=3397674 RepID=UPI0039DF9E86
MTSVMTWATGLSIRDAEVIPVRKRPNSIAIVATVATLAALLSGCTGIPRDSSVHQGQAIQAGDSPAPVFLPSKPQKDASPEEILRGFIDAATSPENKYAIAREFLTPAFGDVWQPDAGVTVDDGSDRTALVMDEQTITLAVVPVADVNASGEYSQIDVVAPVPLRYQFEQVGGQWRISQAPNGTLLDLNTFTDVFSAQKLYFYDPTFTYLVPDQRWYPRGATAPTRIVKGVLAGPSSWLDGAVTTAFPQGTELTADAVLVVGNDAKVDLNAEALNADRVTLQRMRAQLVSSLPAGTSVTVTINQNPQDIGDLGAAAPIVNPRVDARALVLRDGEFGFLAATGQTITPIAGMSDAVALLNPTAVALSNKQTLAAALAPEGVYAVRVGNAPVVIDGRPGLIAPTVDNFGYVWTAQAASPSTLTVTNSSGDVSTVATPWSEASRISSMQVSRDGTRLIALLGSGSDDTRFVVVGITRDGTVPVTLGDPVDLASAEGTPLTATWIDELTVASLTRLPSGEERIIAQRVGGTSSVLESAPDSMIITGGNSLRDVKSLSGTGALLIQRGAGWQERIDEVGLIGTQQGTG